jgi:hypothetical protein
VVHRQVKQQPQQQRQQLVLVLLLVVEQPRLLPQPLQQPVHLQVQARQLLP